jgi:type II secretory pathway predicted ATPase ExeA
MFLDHFGLIEQPFGVTPDPRFLHMGPKYREALASLMYGTDCNRGFLAVIAEPGMGKTSLLYQYLEGLRNKARTAFIFQTDCDSRDFMRHILGDLGLDHTGKNLPAMQAMLNALLTEEMKAGRRFILVIDEAQNLEEKVLESVRLLSNFETPWMKLMQIVIASQPQLAERLIRPSMAQLRQRISSVIRLEPFTSDEINAYIDHRLWVAGYAGSPLFTVRARLGIAKYSRGIPRNINTLCFNAMSVAYGMSAKQVDAKMVLEAAADVEMESLLPKPQKVVKVVMPKRIPASVRPIRPSLVPPLRTAKKTASSNPMVPAFAAFFVLMMLATFSWITWVRGERTPPFDVLMAATPRSASTASEISRGGIEAWKDVETTRVSSSQDGAQAEPGEGETGQPVSAPPAAVNPQPAAEAVPRASAVVLSDASIPAGLSQNDEILTVVVEKAITVRQLSLQYVGKFDEIVRSEIYNLNPGLRDAGHIEIGERLRLPLYLRHEFKTAPPARIRNASLEPPKDTQ